jgi:hypothetical protein
LTQPLRRTVERLEGLSIVLFAILAIVLSSLFLDLSGGQLVRRGIVNQNGYAYDP